ncbi:MAG TPA: VOC family protein [Candidatus Limnocylindrales bacterium]|nr:VOC family protein [Candidatus Limnocylindrales bacterium]
MTILGLHHITLVTSDAQRTVSFYTELLGLRFIKKTVNFDDPGSYHLYFGDETGSPGSAITYFEWKGAPRGEPGIGGTHHFALRVRDRYGLLMWKRRLTDHGLAVSGPLDRNYFTSIYFHDPDGQVIEIATDGPGWTVDEAADQLGTTVQSPPGGKRIGARDEAAIEGEQWPEAVETITPEMALSQGMHHISAIGANMQRTAAFYEGVLGMRRLKMTANFDDPDSAHWYWGVDEGQPGTVVTYFERDPARTPRARMGAGQTHHFALAVADEAVQLRYRSRLLRAGYRVSPVMDRTYFKSMYTNDPDGHIVELATLGPGFMVDEDVATLGQTLRLPPQYESLRGTLENGLTPLRVPEWHFTSKP